MNHLTFLGAWHLRVKVPLDQASPAILQVKDLSLIPVLEVVLLEEFDHRKNQGLNISIVPKSPWLISLCVTLEFKPNPYHLSKIRLPHHLLYDSTPPLVVVLDALPVMILGKGISEDEHAE
jgi:hypothetical protein